VVKEKLDTINHKIPSLKSIQIQDFVVLIHFIGLLNISSSLSFLVALPKGFRLETKFMFGILLQGC